MTTPAEIEISVTPATLSHVEAAARAAQAALDDLPSPFECTPRQLRQRDRLGDILIHTARAHIEAGKIEARLAAMRVVVADQASMLLAAIDSSQPHYRPTPAGEVVELIHELIDLLDDGDETGAAK